MAPTWLGLGAGGTTTVHIGQMDALLLAPVLAFVESLPLVPIHPQHLSHLSNSHLA